MLSLKTCIELTYVIENMTHAEVDRIFHVFDLKTHIVPPSNLSRAGKANILLGYIREPKMLGPFSHSFQMDMLGYIVDHLYRNKDEEYTVGYEDLFTTTYKSLANSLKRDGYIVKNGKVRKVLPEEIQEAETETELSRLLSKFGLTVAKGHLEQAKDNHALGNWAGANGQFRPFVEDLLIGICKLVLPKNECEGVGTAISLLTSTANPPFLRAELNEIEHIEKLWKRMHPQGSHRGLSDEDDCTYRYHMVVVFAHYMLQRLERWLAEKPKK